MSKKSFKGKSISELQNQAEELRAELFALRFQNAMGELEKPHRMKEIRRQVARILTTLQQKKIAGEDVKPLNRHKITISQKLQKEIDDNFKNSEKKVIDKKTKTILTDNEKIVEENKETETKELVKKSISKKTAIIKEKEKDKPKSTKTVAKTNKKEVSNDGKK